jgi:beta-glucanase (GH16 family)
MKIIKLTASMFALVLLTSVGCTDKKEIPVITPAPPVADLNWEFETSAMWQDEFNTNGSPDLTKWSYDIGGNGWGNNELQYYTNGNNASVVDGNLEIVAKKEIVSGRSYSSSRMVSRGKGDFLYGRFEARAKLPKGRGTWPAIWMLSTENQFGPWPSSGEIDIMEHVGYDQNKVHCSVHNSAFNGSRGNTKTASRVIPTATDDFHVYRVDWTPYAVRGYVDGEKYFEYVNDNKGFTTWPYNKKFHMIMNIAVGGNWGGAQGIDDNIFPKSMLVDYVRVYKMIEQ